MKGFQRTVCRSLLLCVVLLLACAAGSACAAEAAPGGETLTVGVPVDRCPMFYLDADTGEITGIGVDLMRVAAEQAGYGVSFQMISEATLKEALDSEEYDLLMPFGSAISSTAGRRSAVSDNLIQTPFTLVTVGNGALPPLNTMRVGMLRSLGGAAETVRGLYPGVEISMYDTMDESVKALRAGEVDALLHNSYVWSYVLQKPSYSDLTVQPAAMFSMDFRAGAPDTPESRVILERLNEGIAATPETRRQAIILDHTSRRLYRYDFGDYFHEYGIVLMLVLLLFVAVIVITVQGQRREQEERMRRMLDHDPLTGVLSLSGFRKRVEELLHEHPDTPYLLTYSNIKNFKYINHNLGRAFGDELLRFWVKKSQEKLGEDEAMGRIVADQFAILRRVGGEELIQQDLREVCEPVQNYLVDRGKGNRIQLCSGVYVLTAMDYQQVDVDRMLDYARAAEKRVRDGHREGFEFYNIEQWEKGKRTAEIVSHLPVAIKNGELQVWYQPQLNYETGEIVGAEALCRWNHAKLGWLQPAEFIPTLEESGLIYELDCFVWDRTCQDLRRWNEMGNHRSVSVNLSRADLRENRNIPGHFYDMVQTYSLTPEQLRIEITETAFVEDPELLISTTVKLREFGFQVEMDDFGSGHSSLHMLKEVPVDRIKLDLHFLTGTGDPEKGRIIVSHMIQMVRELGMNLITEGVENVAQARFLMSRGCSEMQGFYFYKPMSVQEFEWLMEEGSRPASE